jgi:hypothetical protein
MQLENAFCRVNADDGNSDMDALSYCDAFNIYHIGRLQCRQEGASTPSATDEPWARST